MAEDSQDKSQKTEAPTVKKLQDAKKKGQISFSKEVTNFFIISSFLFITMWLIPVMYSKIMNSFGYYFERVADMRITQLDAKIIFSGVMEQVMDIIAVPLGIIVIAILVSAMVQNGFLFSYHPIIPKLEKISIIKGFSRLFSLKSLVEFIKGIFKISIIGIIGVVTTYGYVSNILDSYSLSINDCLLLLFGIVKQIILYSCIFTLVVGLLDYVYQKYEYIKNLRMSKQDIKDELKQSEGNPEVKAKIKQIRSAKAKQIISTTVPMADVIIMNPTHFAIALQYKPEENKPPKCVAKGKDLIALQIKKIAEKNKITIVRNPPLARALYHQIDIDDYIPVDYWKAVAEIISYVYSLKK